MSDAVDVGGGAAQGAAVGFVAAGPIGAVIGGILGGIGGLFKSKSKKYARKASEVEQRMITLKQAVQRRDIVREAFIARQTALAAGTANDAGGLGSSTVQGALSSIGSQVAFNLNYFDTQVANQQERQTYLNRAGKYAADAQGLGDLLSAGAHLYSSFGGKKYNVDLTPYKNG